jgi:hypothetical protein
LAAGDTKNIQTEGSTGKAKGIRIVGLATGDTKNIQIEGLTGKAKTRISIKGVCMKNKGAILKISILAHHNRYFYSSHIPLWPCMKCQWSLSNRRLTYADAGILDSLLSDPPL